MNEKTSTPKAKEEELISTANARKYRDVMFPYVDLINNHFSCIPFDDENKSSLAHAKSHTIFSPDKQNYQTICDAVILQSAKIRSFHEYIKKYAGKKIRPVPEQTTFNHCEILESNRVAALYNATLSSHTPITKKTAYELFNEIYSVLDPNPSNEEAAKHRENLKKAAQILELPPLGKDPTRRIGGRKNDDPMSCAL